MSGPSSHLEHGTAIALGNHAVLIRGPSGSGKSDLALRCIVHCFDPGLVGSPKLVADDQVLLSRRGTRVFASPPATIAGLLEVRGQGPLAFPHAAEAQLVLLAELTTLAAIDRFPDPPLQAHVLGVALPLVKVAAFEASAPAKLLIALARAAFPPPTS